MLVAWRRTTQRLALSAYGAFRSLPAAKKGRGGGADTHTDTQTHTHTHFPLPSGPSTCGFLATTSKPEQRVFPPPYSPRQKLPGFRRPDSESSCHATCLPCRASEDTLDTESELSGPLPCQRARPHRFYPDRGQVWQGDSEPLPAFHAASQNLPLSASTASKRLRSLPPAAS